MPPPPLSLPAPELLIWLLGWLKLLATSSQFPYLNKRDKFVWYVYLNKVLIASQPLKKGRDLDRLRWRVAPKGSQTHPNFKTPFSNCSSSLAFHSVPSPSSSWLRLQALFPCPPSSLKTLKLFLIIENLWLEQWAPNSRPLEKQEVQINTYSRNKNRNEYVLTN